MKTPPNARLVDRKNLTAYLSDREIRILERMYYRAGGIPGFLWLSAELLAEIPDSRHLILKTKTDGTWDVLTVDLM